MRKLLIILTLVLCGCFVRGPKAFYYTHNTTNISSPIKIIPIYIDKDFGPADKTSIYDSVVQWNFALNGYIKLEVKDTNFDMDPRIVRWILNGNGWMILKVDSSNSIVTSLDAKQGPKNGNKILAWANEIGGNRIFIIRDRIDNKWVTGISLHEMGHLLGAKHDNAYLMQPTYHWEDGRCVDYEALKLVAEYQHIPIQKLNYCTYEIKH